MHYSQMWFIYILMVQFQIKTEAECELSVKQFGF